MTIVKKIAVLAVMPALRTIARIPAADPRCSTAAPMICVFGAEEYYPGPSEQ
jgi:hypothetical protein